MKNKLLWLMICVLTCPLGLLAQNESASQESWEHSQQLVTYELEGVPVTFDTEKLDSTFKAYDLYQIDFSGVRADVANHEMFNLNIKMGEEHNWNLLLITNDMRGSRFQEFIPDGNGGYLDVPKRRAITYKGYSNNPGSNGEATRMNIAESFVNGFATVRGQEFFIEPLQITDPSGPSDYYVIYKPEDVREDGVHECTYDAVQKGRSYQDGEIESDLFQHGHGRAMTCLEVDLVTACTWDFVLLQGTPMDANDRITAITNLVEGLYAPFDLDYIIVGQFAPADMASDPFTASDIAEDLLNDMQAFAGPNLPTHDLGQIWTGRDIRGCYVGPDPDNFGLIGCAMCIGCVCGAERYNVCENWNGNTNCLRTLSAHEFGHNWDGVHSESVAGTIMTPTINCSATTFAAGNTTRIQNHIDTRNCLAACCPLTVDCSNIFDQTLSCRADLPPVDFDLPIIVESCGTPILSALTIIPGNSGCPGDEVSITRTYFIQDPDGNMAECMQTFTIVSNQNPTIQCPAGGTVECAADISVSASNATATAECGTPSVSLSGPVINGTPDCPGTTYTYTYTATDFCNRTASCTQVFTISNAGPTIACAGGGIVECAADISVGPGDVVTTTSCGLTPNISIAGPVVNGTPDCPGTTYTYTYTVTDACNRTASCSRTFTIQNDGPTITCPADMIVECFDDIDVDPNDATVVTSCTLGFSTVVSGPVTVGQADCPGTTHTYTYTTTDDCGRTAECEQVFTIQNDPPMVTCPADITVACEDEIMLDPNDATVVTACNLGFTVYIKNPDAMGAPGCDGTVYTYTYVAVDDCGRQGTCTQTVTIENTPATISAPPGGTVECFEDIDISVNDATVENVCADFNLYLAPVTINGEIGCPGTTYTYTYRVVDVCGNTIEEDVVFTNGANAGPSIEAPADITCECFAGVNPNPDLATVTTACNNGVGSTVDVSGPQIIGAMDCPGTRYIYTYTVTDACGRTATDQQTFTINNGPPVFENCPDDNWLILNCEDYGGEEGTIAVIEAWIASVKATNSCGMPLTVFNNFNSNNIGTCINDGYTNVTFRATDNCGRTSFCTGTVVVIDTEAPKIIEEAQDHYEVCNYLTQENLDDWVDANGGAIAYDGCSNEQVFWSTIPNNPTINCMNTMGTTEVTVTFVVRDNCGNKTETTATFYALMGTNDLVQDEGPADLNNEVSGLTLDQNRPNPFKDETLISFSLPEATSATLTIYDVNGRMLKSYQGDYAAGYNEVSINKSELGATGVMYYQLVTDHGSVTKTMLVVD